MSCSHEHEPPHGGKPLAATAWIHWLGDAQQGASLELVPNRLVRTRLLGGVGGVRSNAAPIPIGLFRPRSTADCLRTFVLGRSPLLLIVVSFQSQLHRRGVGGGRVRTRPLGLVLTHKYLHLKTQNPVIMGIP